MKVIRVLPDSGWTGVDNAAARSRRISWRAKGLLLELLSYPPDNDITIAKLAGWAKESRDSGFAAEGREALQMAMRELEREGYVVHVRRRGERGRWETTTYVSTAPEALPQVAPSTALPRSVNQSSVDQYSADQQSANQSLSTYKTDEKTEKKTDEEEAGLQYSSALASARAGRHASAQDHAEAIEAALQPMYERVRQADETYLRDRLLKLERKRPRVFRTYRNAAVQQIEDGEHPERLARVGSSRLIDELSMMYAIRHYAHSDSGVIPQWLFRFH